MFFYVRLCDSFSSVENHIQVPFNNQTMQIIKPQNHKTFYAYAKIQHENFFLEMCIILESMKNIMS